MTLPFDDFLTIMCPRFFDGIANTKLVSDVLNPQTGFSASKVSIYPIISYSGLLKR